MSVCGVGDTVATSQQWCWAHNRTCSNVASLCRPYQIGCTTVSIYNYIYVRIIWFQLIYTNTCNMLHCALSSKTKFPPSPLIYNTLTNLFVAVLYAHKIIVLFHNVIVDGDGISYCSLGRRLSMFNILLNILMSAATVYTNIK